MKITENTLFTMAPRLIGGIILVSAIFAHQPGINFMNWGWGHYLFLFIGFCALLGPTILQNLKKAGRLAIQTGVVAILVLTIYAWESNFGYWEKWPKTTNYYDELAIAFQHDQAAILAKPDPSLLALSDPYDFKLRTDTNSQALWDLSLYKQKYYLYWGPVPSLILVPIKYFYKHEIGDRKLTFGFLIGLFFLNCLLALAIWKDHFSGLPNWLFVLSITTMGLINPIPWLLHLGRIYEAAISAGQFFLIGALYWMYLAFRNDRFKLLNLFMSSVFLTCAIGSRFLLVFPVAWVFLVLLIRLLQKPQSFKNVPGLNYTITLHLLPLLTGITALAWYNWIRFDSVFEFGMKYQLNDFNYPKGYTFFSTSYLPVNIYNYFFQTFQMHSDYPFLEAMVGRGTIFGYPAPEMYYPSHLSGILVASPFIIFASIALYSFFSKNKLIDNLHWLIISLTGMTILSTASILIYFFSSMRFSGDFMPTLTLLALIGSWQGYKIFSQSRWKWAYIIILVVISAITIATGPILALSSTTRVPLFDLSPLAVKWLSRFAVLIK